MSAFAQAACYAFYMSEHPPSRPETRERPNGRREASPASTDPVSTPPHTAEEAARIEQLRGNLASAQAAAPANPTATGEHAAHASTGHGHDGKLKTFGKHSLAMFGYLFSLAWKGLKRWGEMAGKGGGGGHAKASGGDHGGGHH